MEEMAQLAANYGFPMVVAGYLLVRMEPVIRDLQRSIVSLTVMVARQNGMEFEEISEIINN